MDQLANTCKRLLKVAIIGAPNVGKSTLLNRLVQSDISCVSKKAHTTRRNALGVYTENDAQLEFYDSPGLVTREHLLKHNLEESLYEDPAKAAERCDLIAVVVDASNIREQKRLNKGVLSTLHQNKDKESVLVLNKVDILKEKRRLLDITTRLTQGCIGGQLILDKRDLKQMERERVVELNLARHRPDFMKELNGKSEKERPQHKYVIELDQTSTRRTLSPNQIEDPDMVGYLNFSQVFSISALKDDRVDDLRNYLIEQAQPVDEWPHGPDYLSNQNAQEVVSSVIRGKVLDYVDHAIPYLIKFKFLQFAYDEMNSLHITLSLVCPKQYMISKVIGERGATVFRIIEESREVISRTLGCDVKLNIQVDPAKES